MIKLSVNELLQMDKEVFYGKVLCFITDTVWGVGAVLGKDFVAAKEKIYSLKERDFNKPLAVLAPNVDEILKHVQINNNHIYDLMKLWPGALTLVFKKSDDYFDEVTPLDTIGLRIPNSSVALKILAHLGFIATTSVNYSGSAPLNSKEEIEKYFANSIDYLVTDEEPQSKTSSTVVDVTDVEFKILRSGDIKI